MFHLDGLKYFIWKLKLAAIDSAKSHSQMTIYISRLLERDPATGNNILSKKELLTEESFHLDALQQMRTVLIDSGSDLSREEKLDILTLKFPSALTEKYRSDSLAAGERYWRLITEMGFHKFKRAPIEMQRLELFEKLTPDPTSNAHRLHFKRVIKEGDPIELYKDWLEEHIMGLVFQDSARFVHIAAEVFLDCMPKWEVLDALAEPKDSSVRHISSGNPSSPSIATGKDIFLRHGNYWTIQYADKSIHLKHYIGLDYLTLLITNPGKELHVAEIISTGESNVVMDLGNAGEFLDQQAQSEYRKRLGELSEERLTAERDNNQAQLAAINEEHEFIDRHLRSARGLRWNRVDKSNIERARIKVRRNIKAAIEAIRKHHADLSEHLITSVKTGIYCVYQPDRNQPISWVT